MPHLDPKYRIKALDVASGQLGIDWSDGHRSLFHPMWLRHQCACRVCGTPVNALRGLRLHHIPDAIAFHIEANDEQSIELAWTNDGHRSRYKAVWLRDHCYSDRARQERQHRPILWDGRMHNDPPRGRHERLRDLRKPALNHARKAAGLRILQDPKRTDRGGGSRPIDQPCRASAPVSLRYLQNCPIRTPWTTSATSPIRWIPMWTKPTACRPSASRCFRCCGRARTADTPPWWTASRRCAACRSATRKTSTCSHGSRSRVPGRDPAQNSAGQVKWYAATMPVIRLDFDGQVSGVRCNERQIMPLDLPGRLIEPCFQALKRLYEILYDPALRVTFDLAAGEALLFDNQRVLHGRTGFSPEEPARSVLTSSVDIEEFHSSLRLLTEKVRGHVPPLRLPQGMVA